MQLYLKKWFAWIIQLNCVRLLLPLHFLISTQVLRRFFYSFWQQEHQKHQRQINYGLKNSFLCSWTSMFCLLFGVFFYFARLEADLKSVNLQYITLGCLDDGTNGRPRVWCSNHYFYRLRALKTLYFHFCNFIKKIYMKINWKDFCKEFCKKSWKKIILGTSDAC